MCITCWSLLFIFLAAVALVELIESFCGFMKTSHEDLDVVQGAVQDLLEATQTPALHVHVTANLIRSMLECDLDACVWYLMLSHTHHVLLNELGEFQIGLGVLRRQITWDCIVSVNGFTVSTVLISTWCHSITFHIRGCDPTFDPRGRTFRLRGWDDGLPVAFHLFLVQPEGGKKCYCKT